MEQFLQVGVISSTHGIRGRSKSISDNGRSGPVQKVEKSASGYGKRTA